MSKEAKPGDIIWYKLSDYTKMGIHTLTGQSIFYQLEKGKPAIVILKAEELSLAVQNYQQYGRLMQMALDNEELLTLLTTEVEGNG